MAVFHVTKDNFRESVLEAKQDVLLDFWATWCGPCRMIAPVVEQIAEEREDLVVGKVDVDEEREIAIRFGITSIPTLILMRGGEAVKTIVGFRPKADIEKLLAE